MRFAVATFALIFALAGTGLISTEAKAEKDIYGKAPTSAYHNDFPGWAGYAVGTAHICRRYSQRFLSDKRIKRIEKRLKGDPDFDHEIERARDESRGVDIYRNLRPYCDATDNYMDVILSALSKESSEPKNLNSSVGEIIFHAAYNEKDEHPQDFINSLTIGAMPATMYVRNTYDNLELERQVRRVNIYNPDGVLTYSDSYGFTPNQHIWYVWQFFNPRQVFNKPGVWRVETTIKEKSELTSSREIEVHDGN